MPRLGRRDPRVAEEIRYHRDRLIEDYLAEGLDRAEAERRAFLALGNPRQIEEAVRDVRGRWLDDLRHDLKYALRTLRRSPGFTFVSVSLLALGIGANVAVFSIVNAVLLRPLPVPEPHQLVRIARLNAEGRPSSLSYPLFTSFRDRLTTSSGLFAFRRDERAIVMDGETEFVTIAQVTGAYHSVLGVGAAAGRVLVPDDDDPAAPVAAVISDAYWLRRFGRSPGALGRTFTVDDTVVTIVGVTPPWFTSAERGFAPDVTMPVVHTAPPELRDGVAMHWLNVMARLKPGTSIERANAEVDVVWQSTLPQQMAALARADARDDVLRQGADALPAAGGLNPLDHHARTLGVLMGIVALILVLACVNLSGLMLARAAARQRETAVRLAIGAGPGRLARQVLTEMLVLIVLGAATGLSVASSVSPRLWMLFDDSRALALSVGLDSRVAAFAVVISLGAMAVAGLLPVLHAARASLTPSLRIAHARGGYRAGRALVIVQLAISMVLVVGATLFVSTLVNLYAVDPGFERDGVLTVRVGSSRPHPPERMRALQAALIERFDALPGVQSSSAASVLPAEGALMRYGVRVEEYEVPPGASNLVGFNMVAPRYFETLATPLSSGREFTWRDADGAPRVAIVNERFVRRFIWGADNAGQPPPRGPGALSEAAAIGAIGRRVTVTHLGESYEIVGVVRDAKYQTIREEDALPTLYIPFDQAATGPAMGVYVVRTTDDEPMRLAPAIERSVRDLDPTLRVRSTTTYTASIERTVLTERVLATISGLFGGLALAVAAIGLYGLLAYQVTQRTNEIGVRMALGADRWIVTRLVVRDVARMVVLGVALGAAGALTVTDLAQSVLFGLTPSDPRVFLAAASMLGAAVALAAWLPVRRAVAVDPVVALHHD